MSRCRSCSSLLTLASVPSFGGAETSDPLNETVACSDASDAVWEEQLWNQTEDNPAASHPTRMSPPAARVRVCVCVSHSQCSE